MNYHRYIVRRKSAKYLYEVDKYYNIKQKRNEVKIVACVEKVLLKPGTSYNNSQRLIKLQMDYIEPSYS